MLRILLIALINYASAECVFTVLAPDTIPKVPTNTTPFIGSPSACPYYANTPVCCNDVQNQQLQSNFMAIDAAFGSSGGGCDMFQQFLNNRCSNNLKRFWCDYTCSPDQSNFVKQYGEVVVPDPLDSEHRLVPVQNITISVHSDTACELWSSCKRTSFASQVSAMQSPGGFFNFQGQNAVQQAKQTISVFFDIDPDKTLDMKGLLPCNYEAVNCTENNQCFDNYGMQIYQNCSCNNCDLSCNSEVILYQPSGVMEGFNWVAVISVWGVVIFLVAVISITRFFLLKKAAPTTDYTRIQHSSVLAQN